MAREEDIFAAKLRELEGEYVNLADRIRLMEQAEPQELWQALDYILGECSRRDKLLTQSAEGCSFTAMAALARVQLEYHKKMDEIFQKELPHEMQGKNGSEAWDRAEAAALYGEYAIDFATQAVQQAEAAALRAYLLQIQARELDENS